MTVAPADAAASTKAWQATGWPRFKNPGMSGRIIPTGMSPTSPMWRHALADHERHVPGALGLPLPRWAVQPRRHAAGRALTAGQPALSRRAAAARSSGGEGVRFGGAYGTDAADEPGGPDGAE